MTVTLTFKKYECRSTVKNCLVCYEHVTEEMPEVGSASKGIEARSSCERVR